MRKTASSLGHSLRGLSHAFTEERNLRFFLIGHVVLLLLGISVRIDLFSLVFSTFAAGLFVTTELLNTAIERLADTIDDCEKTKQGGHYHIGIKQTKDVAAAASLIMLAVYAGCIAIIALPYAIYFFFR